MVRSRPITDESILDRHTGALPVGRIRPATLEEAERREDLFRPDAVLALTRALPADLSAFEQHVAALVDGVRPVARLRRKSGVGSADLRIALAGLCDRGLLRLAGIVEEAPGKPAGSTGIETTTPGSAAGVIPPGVMAEIWEMIDEDDADE